MIKGVHLLTPRPNMLLKQQEENTAEKKKKEKLISLIDQFTISLDEWMDGQPGGPRRCMIQDFCQGGGPGPTARKQDPHMGRTHTHTYIRMYRQAHECSCTGRRMDIHVHV